MAITVLTTTAPEEGMAAFTISWTDEDGNAVTPSAASWRLTDADGDVINSRSAVTISGLSTSNTVALSGNDLAINDNGNRREIEFTYTYTSSLGTFTTKKAVRFDIDDAWGTT